MTLKQTTIVVIGSLRVKVSDNLGEFLGLTIMPNYDYHETIKETPITIQFTIKGLISPCTMIL